MFVNTTKFKASAQASIYIYMVAWHFIVNFTFMLLHVTYGNRKFFHLEFLRCLALVLAHRHYAIAIFWLRLNLFYS